MKLNKYILPIALAVSALSFSSCNDFLDRHPQGQFTEDDNPGACLLYTSDAADD